MTTEETTTEETTTQIDWHRLFGITLADYFKDFVRAIRANWQKNTHLTLKKREYMNWLGARS
jgi:hypothetical protein